MPETNDAAVAGVLVWALRATEDAMRNRRNKKDKADPRREGDELDGDVVSGQEGGRSRRAVRKRNKRGACHRAERLAVVHGNVPPMPVISYFGGESPRNG
jgi:hypothetical protein